MKNFKTWFSHNRKNIGYIAGGLLTLFAANSVADITINFKNNSGLTNQNICLQGYANGEPKYFLSSVSRTSGSLLAFTPTPKILPTTPYPFPLTSVPISQATIPPASGASITVYTTTQNQSVSSARIYAYVVPRGTSCSNRPLLTVTAVCTNTKSTIKCGNPGNPWIPPYSIIQPAPLSSPYPYVFFEPTFTKGGNSTFDISSADSFSMPVSATIGSLAPTNSPTNLTLGQNSPSLNLEAITSFFTTKFRSTSYSILLNDYPSAYPPGTGQILNPHDVLSNAGGKASTCPQYASSPLHNIFDIELNKLFGRTVKVWFNGGSDLPYTGTPKANMIIPGTTLTQSGLTFVANTVCTKATYPSDPTCSTHPSPCAKATYPTNPTCQNVGPGSFNVYSPVGAVVFRDIAGNSIQGKTTVGSKKIDFLTPLPAGSLQAGMIAGGGATNQNRILAISVFKGSINSVTLDSSFNPNTNTNQYCFSKFPASALPSGQFASSGDMVYGNWGVFNNLSGYGINIENMLVTALNRGVANITGPVKISQVNYSDAVLWANQNNWYPPTIGGQNIFSYAMHTAKVNSVPLFTRPTTTAGNPPMGMAYGFGWDETPAGFLSPNPAMIPNVPSKWDSLVPPTSIISVTFQPWISISNFSIRGLISGISNKNGGSMILQLLDSKKNPTQTLGNGLYSFGSLAGQTTYDLVITQQPTAAKCLFSNKTTYLSIPINDQSVDVVAVTCVPH